MKANDFNINISALNKIYVSALYTTAELKDVDWEVDLDEMAICVISQFITSFKGVPMPSFKTDVWTDIISDGPNAGMTAVDIELVGLEWPLHAFIFNKDDVACGIVDTDAGCVAFIFNPHWVGGCISQVSVEEIEGSGHFRTAT